MEVCKGTTEHINELESLYNSLNDYFASGVNYPGWIKHIYPIRETAIEGISEDNLFIAKIDDVVVGSVILNHKPEEAYKQARWNSIAKDRDIIVIHTLVVHPSYMNKGVALALMNFAKEYAIEQKMKSIRLDVSVNNSPAIALYERLGYEYVGTVDLGLPYEHLKWFKLYEMCL